MHWFVILYYKPFMRFCFSILLILCMKSFLIGYHVIWAEDNNDGEEDPFYVRWYMNVYNYIYCPDDAVFFYSDDCTNPKTYGFESSSESSSESSFESESSTETLNSNDGGPYLWDYICQFGSYATNLVVKRFTTQNPVDTEPMEPDNDFPLFTHPELSELYASFGFTPSLEDPAIWIEQEKIMVLKCHAYAEKHVPPACWAKDLSELSPPKQELYQYLVELTENPKSLEEDLTSQIYQSTVIACNHLKASEEPLDDQNVYMHFQAVTEVMGQRR